MRMRTYVGMLGLVLWAAAVPAAELPDATAGRLPRWRGFNLTNKFSQQWARGPFEEKDFELIRRWGFNFVRLPMDYRLWCVEGNPERFDERVLKEIDQAVAWGRKHGLHVCLNLHRAPGYCVNPPAEPLNLWKDDEALRLCALHWRMFARRYKGIPSRELSFNLLNEPKDIDAPTYLRVVRELVRVIREEDPGRLIIADGLRWAADPVPELKELGVAQATRGYAPHEVSHYRASWVAGSDRWAVPQWPQPDVPGYLYGPGQRALAAPLVLQGPFPEGSRLRLRVGTVSARARLVIRAGGRILLDRLFVPGPGEGEWKEAVYRPQYQVYQNRYDLDVEAAIPEDAREVVLENTEGDWMTWSELSLEAGGVRTVLPSTGTWGVKPSPVRLVRTGPSRAWRSESMRDRAWLVARQIRPWQVPEMAGVGIVVGEWGAHNQTPHAVALAWMEDCLKNWQEAGWGWALWNFKGSFGVLDSERADVQYEDFEGHKLDRTMLELLQRY